MQMKQFMVNSLATPLWLAQPMPADERPQVQDCESDANQEQAAAGFSGAGSRLYLIHHAIAGLNTEAQMMHFIHLMQDRKGILTSQAIDLTACRFCSILPVRV